MPPIGGGIVILIFYVVALVAIVAVIAYALIRRFSQSPEAEEKPTRSLRGEWVFVTLCVVVVSLLVLAGFISMTMGVVLLFFGALVFGVRQVLFGPRWAALVMLLMLAILALVGVLFPTAFF